MPIGMPVSASLNRRCELALARVIRTAAEGGTPFEELLSRSPFLEQRLLDMAFDSIARGGRSERSASCAAQARPPEGSAHDALVLRTASARHSEGGSTRASPHRRLDLTDPPSRR